MSDFLKYVSDGHSYFIKKSFYSFFHVISSIILYTQEIQKLSVFSKKTVQIHKKYIFYCFISLPIKKKIETDVIFNLLIPTADNFTMAAASITEFITDHMCFFRKFRTLR